MTVPVIAPLALVSDVRGDLNADTTDTTVAARIRAVIQAASQLLTELCRRRFDERIETRYYTCLPQYLGGALVGGYELALDDDLRAITTLLNGDGTAISASLYKLLPQSAQLDGAHIYHTVRLNPYSTGVWSAGVNDPADAIQVTGRWGYGGAWESVSTLSGNLTDSATTFTLSNLETGMTLKIDSEYLYVEASGSPNTVARAFLGSTAAAHSSGATVYRWRAQDVIHSLVKRLTLWRIAQNQAPLFGQTVIGDLAFPVRTDALPPDVLSALRDSGLVRPSLPVGV